MFELNGFSLLFNIWASFLWVVPFLILIYFFKSSYFKGKVGEILINMTNRTRLDSSIYTILKDVTIKLEDGTTTQIDHILVSKFGIFVIETKNMKGFISGSEKQKNWTQNIYGNKYTFQNPLHQNYKHTSTISELLGFNESIYSIVVFVGDCKIKSKMPKNVFINGEYITYIKSFKKQVFTTIEVSEIISLINAGSLEKGRTTNKEHILSLKKREENNVTLKRVCKKCASSMVERKNRKTGIKFLGCSNYPQCKNTEPL